jgi:UDP-N-acetylmuramate dehydrogenase
MPFSSTLPAGLRNDVALAPYTSWRIGGPARFLAEPGDAAALADALGWAEAEGLRVYLLGGGSNVLVADEGLDGLVIRLDTAGAFGRVAVDAESGTLTAGGGAPLGRLLREAALHGLSGLEFLAGVPGTVGGAVAMNAGDPAHGIGGRLLEAIVLDRRGTRHVVRRGEAHFAYRWTSLGGWIVTEARFGLDRSDPDAVGARMETALQQKRSRQPLAEATAGCVFRNPGTNSAGRLIEAAGFKGGREGGAVVSGMHANFIVNAGGARAGDVRRLIDRIREGVHTAFGIRLTLEVKLWL